MAVEMNDGLRYQIFLAQINGRTKLTELQQGPLENMVLYVPHNSSTLDMASVTALPISVLDSEFIVFMKDETHLIEMSRGSTSLQDVIGAAAREAHKRLHEFVTILPAFDPKEGPLKYCLAFYTPTVQ
ncbi:MAG: hypothetical protein AABX00_00895 [Nanoarchaeota archaeon]